MAQRYYTQIDIMKGLAILGVIFTHAVSASHQHHVHTIFHANQAVPVFITVMAMNLSWSMQRSDGALMGHYARRMRRLLVPFGVILALSIVIATVRWFTIGAVPTVGWLNLLGYLPFGGPGNYFIGVLIALTAIGPFLWEWYRRQPVVAVVGMLAADLAFEFAAGRLPEIFGHSPLYAVNPLRFLGAFAIGLWLADGWKLTDRRNLWLIGYAALSLVSLIAHQFGHAIPWIQAAWQPMHVLTFGYTAFLVMLGMRFLPSRAPRYAWSVLAQLGKASYHIYLVQILYFGFTIRFQLIPLVSDMVRPAALGWGFFWLDRRFGWSSPRPAARGA